MSSKAGEYFKFIIIVQIIFGFFLTTTLYFLPADTKGFVSPWTGEWTQLGGEAQVEESELALEKLQSKSNMVIQAIGLVQTGIYVVDLFINSLFAIPEMIAILFGGVFSLLPISPYLQAQLSAVVLAICIVSFVLILIGFMTSVRSGTVI